MTSADSPVSAGSGGAGHARVMPGERGWFWPDASRKAHYDGGDGTSLCGRWMRWGFGGTAPFLATQDNRSPDDCATCAKKLAKLAQP
jgi:hypothetical protein